MMKYATELGGIPAETEQIVATDVAQQFTAAQHTIGGKAAISVLVTCEIKGIRFCLGGSTPTQGYNGLGHILSPGESIKLTNPKTIQTFSFINQNNGEDATLQVSFATEIG